MGPGGPVGLDYLAVYPLLDRLHADDAAAWDATFDDVRVIEIAALDYFDEMRDQG